MTNPVTVMEPATVVNGSKCSACAAGGVCALDGFIPDFEVGLAAALFHRECPILCVRGLGLQVVRESVGVSHG